MEVESRQAIAVAAPAVGCAADLYRHLLLRLLVALLLAVLTAAYFLPVSFLIPALYTSPVFFAVAAILLLVEVSYQLYREGRDVLSFVDWDGDESASYDKSQPPAQ